MSLIRDNFPEYPLQQWLDDNGEWVKPLPAHWAAPERWLEAYTHLWRTRLFDRRAIALQRTGQLGTYAGCLGQEAVSGAVGYALRDDDILVPYYRDQAAQLKRGVRMSSILRFWGGDEWGAHDGPPRDLSWCIPIATQITHAAGVATALKLRHESGAVLTTCGDGASSRGDFYEALNLAGVWHTRRKPPSGYGLHPSCSASFGMSVIMRPIRVACVPVNRAIDGICSLGITKKCTGAHGWMS